MFKEYRRRLGIAQTSLALPSTFTILPNSRLFIVGNREFAEYMSESFDFCSRVTYTGMLDIDALAAKMLYVLQNPDVAHELGYNARKRYENIYSSSKMGHAMTEFYLDLSKDKNEIDI